MLFPPTIHRDERRGPFDIVVISRRSYVKTKLQRNDIFRNKIDHLFIWIRHGIHLLATDSILITKKYQD
jgi:hypothetical protein